MKRKEQRIIDKLRNLAEDWETGTITTKELEEELKLTQTLVKELRGVSIHE